MLNGLTQHQPCVITTRGGASIAGVYGGVETGHGDWFVLVGQDVRTLSIPLECIASASATDGT